MQNVFPTTKKMMRHKTYRTVELKVTIVLPNPLYLPFVHMNLKTKLGNCQDLLKNLSKLLKMNKIFFCKALPNEVFSGTQNPEATIKYAEEVLANNKPGQELTNDGFKARAQFTLGAEEAAAESYQTLEKTEMGYTWQKHFITKPIFSTKPMP